MNAAVKIDRIEPTDWYVGLKDASLQLMVYGEGIKTAEVTTDYPGVRIDSLVRLDSPNYLLVYMDVKEAQPGTMTLQFQQGKQKKKVAWQSLVERNGSTYVVCHGLMEFIDAVCRYIRVNPQPYKEKALNLYPTYR